MNPSDQKEITQYLTFRLGREIFAIDVIQVREVLDLVQITKVPQTPRFMLGVINLRGSVVPVVDLRIKFGISETEKTRDTCVVVMEVPLEGEVSVIGALADSVEEVLELDQSQIEPPPRLGTRLKTDFLKGMGKRGEEFIMLLDIGKIFSADELDLLQGASESREAPADSE